MDGDRAHVLAELDDPDVVHHADDRPHGLVEGTVLRDDVPPAEVARLGTPGS